MRSFDGEDSGKWLHDKQPRHVANPHSTFTVIVRNVPLGVDPSLLREICDNPEFLTGVRISSGIAEINFSKRSAAE